MVPAVLHRLDDGGEVVVGEDHGGGVLGHLGAGDAHGHADVRLLQGGGVVDAVAGHGHQGALLLPGADDADLMLRGHPGIDGDFGDELLEFLLAHLFHHSAFHGFGAGGEDADLLGLLGLLPRGVHHGDEAQEEEVVLVLQGDLHGLHPAAGEGQHPEALFGEGLVDPLDLLPLSGAQEGAVQEHVHGALGHKHVPSGELVEGGHELPVGVKGELPQPGPVLPDVQFVEAEVLPQPDQGGLGGVADLPLLVHGGVAGPSSGFGSVSLSYPSR